MNDIDLKICSNAYYSGDEETMQREGEQIKPTRITFGIKKNVGKILMHVGL